MVICIITIWGFYNLENHIVQCFSTVLVRLKVVNILGTSSNISTHKSSTTLS